MKLTNKVRQQKLVDNAHSEALMGQWKCERVTCPNQAKSGWCFEADGVHLKLSAVHIRSWSIAINNEEATLDCPPDNLSSSLMPAKGSESNPFRKQKKSSPLASPAQVAMATHPFMPYGLPGYPSHSSMFHQHSGISVSPQTPMIMGANTSTVRADPVDTTIRSSPPVEIDPVERMHCYFNWLVSQSPSQAGSLQDAKEKLVLAGHNFSTIFKMSDAQWHLMEVPLGIVMQIQLGGVKFKKHERKNIN
jgi:hypothetical protein